MINIIEKDINKKRTNFLKPDLNKYLIDKNQKKEYLKFLWFKGSRYR